jgi:hypothetical protein
MSSEGEAEIGAVFLNAKEGTVLHTTLKELGHTEPPTPLQTDSTTATGYINGTIKQKMHTSYGYALLLGKRQGKTKAISCLLRPMIPTFSGLFYKTPFAGAS